MAKNGWDNEMSNIDGNAIVDAMNKAYMGTPEGYGSITNTTTGEKIERTNKGETYVSPEENIQDVNITALIDDVFKAMPEDTKKDYPPAYIQQVKESYIASTAEEKKTAVQSLRDSLGIYREMKLYTEVPKEVTNARRQKLIDKIGESPNFPYTKYLHNFGLAGVLRTEDELEKYLSTDPSAGEETVFDEIEFKMYTDE